MKKRPVMAVSLAVLLTVSIAGSCASEKKDSPPPAGDGALDYSNQSAWEFVSGQSQSPVDIVTGDAVEVAGGAEGVFLSYAEKRITSQVRVIDNGHAVEAEAEGSALINSRRFELTQFHFHAASEHTLDAKPYVLEAHFVHRAEDGRLAVVAVLFEEGEENPALDRIIGAVGSGEEVGVELYGLFPESFTCYHYNGSLTTPPLTENVEWYVLDTPVTLSSAQLELLKSYYPANNRDVQPMNGRPLVHIGE